MIGNAQPHEKFCWALALGGIKPGPYLDLAVGVPGEFLYPTGGLPGHGMAHVLYNNK